MSPKYIYRNSLRDHNNELIAAGSSRRFPGCIPIPTLHRAFRPFLLSTRRPGTHFHCHHRQMPLPLSSTGPTLAIRREAFESAGLSRSTLDRILSLTDDEFRVEGALIALGPLQAPDDVPDVIELLEGAGLVYFDDFMEIPGGFPEWITLYARHS